MCDFPAPQGPTEERNPTGEEERPQDRVNTSLPQDLYPQRLTTPRHVRERLTGSTVPVTHKDPPVTPQGSFVLPKWSHFVGHRDHPCPLPTRFLPDHGSGPVRPEGRRKGWSIEERTFSPLSGHPGTRRTMSESRCHTYGPLGIQDDLSGRDRVFHEGPSDMDSRQDPVPVGLGATQ